MTPISRIDGAQTRQKILSSAGQLFATLGFADVTSKMICEHAQVDLTSINYHFSSRNDLYHTILERGQNIFFDQQRLDALLTLNLPAKSIIERMIDHLVSLVYLENNWDVKAFARELLAPTAHLQAIMQHAVWPKINAGIAAISMYTHLKGDDPILLATLINAVSPCLMLLSSSSKAIGPLQHLASLPQSELNSYLKTYIFGGLDGIRSVALHNPIT